MPSRFEFAGAQQLLRLLDAVMAIGSEQTLADALRRITETAADLVDAKYAALGVLDESGSRLAEFITVGLDEEEVRVVHAWRRPCAGTSRRHTDLDRADAQCVVDLAIRHCEKRTSVPVSGELIEGEAAAVLTAASSGVDLLAVGSRGRSGFKTMLFGSVALFVAGHSSCPVAVVHPHVRSE